MLVKIFKSSHFSDSGLNWKLDVAVVVLWSYRVMESSVRNKDFYFQLLFIYSLKSSCQVLLCSENSFFSLIKNYFEIKGPFNILNVSKFSSASVLERVAPITGPSHLVFFFPSSSSLACDLRILRDSHDVVYVTMAPLKTAIVLSFTGNTSPTVKCKSDAADGNRWGEAWEHTGTNSFAW